MIWVNVLADYVHWICALGPESITHSIFEQLEALPRSSILNMSLLYNTLYLQNVHS